MKFSKLFLDIRIHFECSGDITKFLKAYTDNTGTWTIGLGTTIYPDGSKVKRGDTCTGAEALQYAFSASSHLEAQIGPTITKALTQAQFDAIGDFCYNNGFGPWSSSTLRKLINADPSNFTQITAAFEVWDKAHVDGKLAEVPGLLRRRKCEAFLYQNGYNHPTFFESDPAIA